MYEIQIDHIRYSGYRNGAPFTLADCWRETEGVGNAKILTTTGRVVLFRAGEKTGRRLRVRRDYYEARAKRLTRQIHRMAQAS